MKDFRSRLIELMKNKRFNSSTLSIALGAKTPSTVHAWVNGKGMPELKMIEKLAIVLETTAPYLLYGIKEPPPDKVEEPQTLYGSINIKPEELIEFYQWKAQKAAEEAQTAQNQVERLKSAKVDAM